MMVCVKDVIPFLPRVRLPSDELNDTLSSLPFKATSSIFDDEYVDVVDVAPELVSSIPIFSATALTTSESFSVVILTLFPDFSLRSCSVC